MAFWNVNVILLFYQFEFHKNVQQYILLDKID